MTDLLQTYNPEHSALIMKQLLLGLKAYKEDKKYTKIKKKIFTIKSDKWLYIL